MLGKVESVPTSAARVLRVGKDALRGVPKFSSRWPARTKRSKATPKPIPPLNGTWPPRTVYPPDYFHPDSTPRPVPFRRDPKPPQFEA
jgi:hypothetical protein